MKHIKHFKWHLVYWKKNFWEDDREKSTEVNWQHADVLQQTNQLHVQEENVGMSGIII